MSKNQVSDRVQEELGVIVANAYATGKEITLNQAEFIRRRSLQLKREGEKYPAVDLTLKIKQINECWKKKDRQSKK